MRFTAYNEKLAASWQDVLKRYMDMQHPFEEGELSDHAKWLDSSVARMSKRRAQLGSQVKFTGGIPDPEQQRLRDRILLRHHAIDFNKGTQGIVQRAIADSPQPEESVFSPAAVAAQRSKPRQLSLVSSEAPVPPPPMHPAERSFIRSMLGGGPQEPHIVANNPTVTPAPSRASLSLVKKAFLAGQWAALAKFGASTDVPHSDWWLEPTTDNHDASDAVRRAFNTNAELGRDSNMTQPGTLNLGDKCKTDAGSFGNATDSMGGTG